MSTPATMARTATRKTTKVRIKVCIIRSHHGQRRRPLSILGRPAAARPLVESAVVGPDEEEGRQPLAFDKLTALVGSENVDRSGQGIGRHATRVNHADRRQPVGHRAAGSRIDGVRDPHAVALEVVAIVARCRHGGIDQRHRGPQTATVRSRVVRSRCATPRRPHSDPQHWTSPPISTMKSTNPRVGQAERHPVDGIALGDRGEVAPDRSAFFSQRALARDRARASENRWRRAVLRWSSASGGSSTGSGPKPHASTRGPTVMSNAPADNSATRCASETTSITESETSNGSVPCRLNRLSSESSR